MLRVAIATTIPLPEPDPDQELMLEAFRSAGVVCDLLPWDGDHDLATWDAVVLRSTWNYHLKPTEFQTWVSMVTNLQNPAHVVLDNIDKRYLLELESNGVPIVATFIVDSPQQVSKIASNQDWSRVVIKPTIGASSYKTGLFSANDPEAQEWLNDILTVGEAMIQPYVESVDSGGERSLVWIDGEFTHKVVKKPRFSADEESVSEAQQLTDAEKVLGLKALEGIKGLLYARIDVMEYQGRLVVSELELIEPSLFFKQNPGALERLVTGVRKRI